MLLPRRVTLCSYRLGGTDGVSVEAEKWRRALRSLGCSVTTVAGAGVADRIVPGLAADALEPPDTLAVARALEDADLVVVENLCSLPLNPSAGACVASLLAGRPAVLHHHDLATQRPSLAHFGAPPDWPGALHVTINQLSFRELAAWGIASTVIHNTFEPDPAPGRRATARRVLGVEDNELLVLQPTRAIPRKNVPGALALCESLGATYWLLGPAEDGYGPELSRILARASVRVLRGWPENAEGFDVTDAYAACDVVALPSTWEGFGNPAIESATRDRPLAIGRYPVASELRAFGFEWFDADAPDALAAWCADRDPALVEHNHELARRHFSSSDLPRRLERLLSGTGVPDTMHPL